MYRKRLPLAHAMKGQARRRFDSLNNCAVFGNGVVGNARLSKKVIFPTRYGSRVVTALKESGSQLLWPRAATPNSAGNSTYTTEPFSATLVRT